MFQKPIKKIITKIFPKKMNKAVVYTKKTHRINPRHLSRNAIKVCEVLQKRGFEAYIVGGAIRDLLLNIEPKDFDVATNATPNQIRKCFRRSRIIGRRFKIVHIFFGSEVIETTTFRQFQPIAEESTDEFGRLLDDNHYGSLQEDSNRRDFTVNALYYDPIKEEILDFHHGYKDLKNKVIRIIGDSNIRYREDPVRMLRAIRFSSKLNATIEKRTAKPILTLAPLLKNIPISRMNEEAKKILFSGNAYDCIHHLETFGIPLTVLPGFSLIQEQIRNNKFLELTFERTDHRIRSNQPVNLGFLYAAILWRKLNHRWQQLAKNMPLMPALIQATNEVLEEDVKPLGLMRVHVNLIRNIWLSQPKFDKPKARFIFKMVYKPYFRAACDFLQLRAAAGEFDSELAQWWMDIANEEDHDAKKALVEQGLKAPSKDNAKNSTGKPSKRRRRRRRKPKKPQNSEIINTTDQTQNNDS